MEHLLEFFDRYIKGSSVALTYDNGFRRWSYTHDQLRAAAEAALAQRVHEAVVGLQPLPADTPRRASDAAA